MRKLTESELNEAKKIQAESRYDALDKLAKVLDASTADTFKWARNSKCITSDGCKIDITTKKNKKTGFIEITDIAVFGINKEWAMYKL